MDGWMDGEAAVVLGVGDEGGRDGGMDLRYVSSRELS